jgi:hypothetical protein
MLSRQRKVPSSHIQTWRVRSFLRTLDLFRRCCEVSATRGLVHAFDWHASKHGFAQLS